MNKLKSSGDLGDALGTTAGNRTMPIETGMGVGMSSGESHPFNGNEQFAGPTKGNTDLKPDRSTGYDTGHGGGANKAGGK